jgi:hypothetical protein
MARESIAQPEDHLKADRRVGRAAGAIRFFAGKQPLEIAGNFAGAPVK